jgi:hypothetical protein
MSKLEVDKIDPQSGTDLELGTSGDTITIPAGVTFDSSAATNTLPSTVVTTTGTQTLTNKTIDGSQLTDETVTTAKLAYNPNAFRNIIINGDMSIAQRGTSFTGLGDTDSQYTLDRFKWTEEGSSGTAEFTITQSTDVPTGQGFATSLKLDCTTADTSVDSGNIIYIEQRVEGQNLQYLKYGTASAESTTLSFWVKSNKTGTYTVNALGDIGGSGKLYSQAYTISDADTWEKKTLTFIGDTALAINNNSSTGIQLMWNLLAGTDKSSGSLQTWGSNTQANRAVGQVNLADDTANEWYITGIQWEAGTTASDFEFLPVDVNLARCQRYYFKQQATKTDDFFGSGYVSSSTGALSFNTFPVQMRTIPSALEQSGTAGDYRVAHRATTTTCNAVPAISGVSIWGARTSFTVSSGLTAGDGCMGRSVNSNAYLAWSAEL